MKLAEYLRVPYVMQVEPLATGEPNGAICRVSYPELPDCEAEAATIEQAIEQLERKKVDVILNILRSGNRPATPRSSLYFGDALAGIKSPTKREELTSLLGLDDCELKNRDAGR